MYIPWCLIIFYDYLLIDTAKQLDSWQTQGTVDPNIEIPLLMQNQVPEGYETDEHLDVSLRPDGVCKVLHF